MSDLKYKVGDYVKNLCVAKHQNHLTTPVGSVGIIIEVDDGDELPYLVKSEDFTKEYWFKESELELVQDSDDSIYKKLSEGISKISIGDSVIYPPKPPKTKQYNPLDVQEGGVKFDSNKEEYSLLPKGVLKPIMRVLGFGAKKYAKDNWMKVPNAKERYFNALHRHLDAWWCGEKYDKETGENHLAHAACCLLFLLWFEGQGVGEQNDQ